MYRPYTDRLPPLSGIDGDVHDPSKSLADAGIIDLAKYKPDRTHLSPRFS
jgi:hypothetical protein